MKSPTISSSRGQALSWREHPWDFENSIVLRRLQLGQQHAKIKALFQAMPKASQGMLRKLTRKLKEETQEQRDSIQELRQKQQQELRQQQQQEQVVVRSKSKEDAIKPAEETLYPEKMQELKYASESFQQEEDGSIPKAKQEKDDMPKVETAASPCTLLRMVDEDLFCNKIISYIHPRRIPMLLSGVPELCDAYHLTDHFCPVHGLRLKKEKYKIATGKDAKRTTTTSQEERLLQEWKLANPAVHPTSCGRCYLLSTKREKCHQCSEIRPWKGVLSCGKCHQPTCPQCYTVCGSYCGQVVCHSCATICPRCEESFCGQTQECRTQPCGQCRQDNKLCRGCLVSHQRHDCPNGK